MKGRRISKKNRRRSRSRRRSFSRRLRGGGDKQHACMIPFVSGEPAAIKNNVPDEGNTENKIKEAVRAIPSDVDFVVLKIGSNDSAEVVSGKYPMGMYGLSSGSKGKNGVHYIEWPPTGEEGYPTTALNIKKIPLKQLNRLWSLFTKLGDNGYLLAVSPIPSYTEFEYPFHDTSQTNIMPNSFFNSVAKKLKTKLYVQSFFPLNTYGKNKELLDLIVAIDKPLILFNAMASTCYTSMKYILDLRFRAGRTTYFMGLADVDSSTLECDVLSPIYPDREKACPKAATGENAAGAGAGAAAGPGTAASVGAAAGAGAGV